MVMYRPCCDIAVVCACGPDSLKWLGFLGNDGGAELEREEVQCHNVDVLQVQLIHRFNEPTNIAVYV